MKPSYAEKPFTNIGLTALPVMCCLLAAVVFLCVPSGPAPGQVSQKTARTVAQARADFGEMETVLQQMKQTVDKTEAEIELEKALQQIKPRIEDLEHRKQALSQQVSDDQLLAARIRDLKTQIAKLEKEKGRAQDRIRGLEKAPAAEPVNASGWPGGTYTGRYVLVECLQRDVVVHPGERHIDVDAPQSDMDWLREKIRKAGAVALVPRPSGFEESFPKFQKMATELAKNESIVLCFWPIEPDEAIAQYLPKGGSQ